MPKFVQVATRSQIPENGVIGVQVEGKNLALINLNGEIYALDDECPHEAAPLSDGRIVGTRSSVPGIPRISISGPVAS